MSRHFDHTIAPNKLVPRRDYESHNDLDGTTDGIEDRTIRSLGFLDSRSLIDVNGTYHNDIIVGIGKKDSGVGCAAYFTDIEGDLTEWKSAYVDTGGVTLLESSDEDPSFGPAVEVDDYLFFPSGTTYGGKVGQIDTSSSPHVIDGDLGTTDSYGDYWDIVRGPDHDMYVTRLNLTSSSSSNCIDTFDEAGTVTTDVFCAQGRANINGLCRNGNYLGLGVTDRVRGRNAELHIWDTVNDDPVAVIEWGSGRFQWLESINGDYLGITAENLLREDYLENGTREMVLRVSSGGVPRFVTKFYGQATLGSGNEAATNPVTWKRSDEFLFYTRIATNAGATTFEEGLWSVRKSSTGKYALTLAYDTSSLGEVLTWIGIGDHAYFVHGETSSVSRINTSESYTETSSFDTLYNPQMPTNDYFKDKILNSFRIKSEPLPSAGQIVVKYRTDEASSWTTIATITTDNLITYEITNEEATGNELPDFKEIQFRLESTGGAVITGYEYVYETKDDLIDG